MQKFGAVRTVQFRAEGGSVVFSSLTLTKSFVMERSVFFPCEKLAWAQVQQPTKSRLFFFFFAGDEMALGQRGHQVALPHHQLRREIFIQPKVSVCSKPSRPVLPLSRPSPAPYIPLLPLGPSCLRTPHPYPVWGYM